MMGATALADFKDKHKGEIGFIVGSGYSLNDVDIDQLTSAGVTFVCNAAVLHIPDADYFVFCDTQVLCFDYYDQALRTAHNVCYFNEFMHDVYAAASVKGSKHWIPKEYTYGTTRSFDSPQLICGTNIAHAATHFAHVCGCSPLILVGIDCDACGSDKYAVPEKDLVKSKVTPFNPIINVNDTSMMPDAVKEWALIKKANPEVLILNAGRGSLDVFPRINLAEYLGEGKKSE